MQETIQLMIGMVAVVIVVVSICISVVKCNRLHCEKDIQVAREINERRAAGG